MKNESDKKSKKPNANKTTLARKLIGWLIRNKLNKNKQQLEESVAELLEDTAGQNRHVTKEEKLILHNVLDFGNKDVEDIMIPRTDIVSVSSDLTLEKLKDFAIQEGHTRIPVYKGTLDEVIGFIHVKDLLGKIGKNESDFQIKDIIRNILVIPPSMKLVDLLVKMRSSRVHIAIVIDEYGGTDGLVTIEDLVEEIVGEIEDEHDEAEDHEYLILNDNKIEMKGRLELDTLKELVDIKVSSEDAEDSDTVGGLICNFLGRIPNKGEMVKYSDEFEFEIMDADPRHIKKIILHHGNIKK